MGEIGHLVVGLIAAILLVLNARAAGEAILQENYKKAGECVALSVLMAIVFFSRGV